MFSLVGLLFLGNVIALGTSPEDGLRFLGSLAIGIPRVKSRFFVTLLSWFVLFPYSCRFQFFFLLLLLFFHSSFAPSFFIFNCIFHWFFCIPIIIDIDIIRLCIFLSVSFQFIVLPPNIFLIFRLFPH